MKYTLTYYWMGIDRTIVCSSLDELIEEILTVKDNPRCENITISTDI